jgi:hypothetical protein
LFVFCTFALSAPLAHAIVPKELAGPPSEFAAMRAPDPVEAAIYSKSALIPVEAIAGGWQGRLPVENGRLRFAVFGGGAVELAPPGGRFAEAASVSRAATAPFGIENATLQADYYTLDEAASGEWTVKVDGAARGGYVLLEGDDAIELVSYQTHRRQLVGESIGVTAALSAASAEGKALVGNAAGRVDAASLRVTAPDGTIETLPMFDDGRHDDGAAGDGVYGGAFAARQAGTYLAQAAVRGANGKDRALVRTAEHVIAVVDRSLSLAANAAATAKATGDGRFTLGVPVDARKSEQHYRAFAEVWGRDGAGNAVPVAWVGGMTTPKAGLVNLGLDARWLSRSGAKAPFELRHLRIEDPDHFVSVASAERLPLALSPGRLPAASATEALDERMTMGVRPAATKGTGKRLILVHGYCSGGVWPASQFATASTFLDTNQNRSHDAFARLLQTFGSTWASFGTVAHSQGGAASLHLYTYYWSGLDSATGNRLIQSVGTPYQGTNLAGILATLGSWFGVGCGTNDNLSYSGASAWLAGIPNANRAKVNYYTTAFKTTNWWTNDYCNVATDLVLNDPEDGTTEQSKGQLSGAVNRGHTTGQCHTSGMRDPAQYQDASRNATMNTNAAR